MIQHPYIGLYESSGVGLIIEYPSGVRYMNQVAGVACLHPEIEGVYFPLATSGGYLEGQLMGVFGEHGYWGGITDAIADQVDAVLSGYSLTSDFRIDRTRLRQTHEAWVWVAGRCFELADFGEMHGVITWENSD